MAITGRFQADFSQFNAEVTKAEAHLKGFEAQAQGAAVSADRIGASSSIATTGVAELTAATSGLTTSQNLATLSIEQLDAMVAGEAVAMGTATAATEAAAVSAGAYGSVLFATAEAEVVATTATAGFATSLVAGAAAVSAFVATIAPWLIAIGVAVELIKKYIDAQREALKAEADRLQKADLFTRATEEAGHAVTTLAEAEKILEAAQRHRLLLNPELAAQAYIDKLSEQGKATIKAASEEAALTEGLAAHGIVLGETIDVEKQMTEARKKATEEAKKHEEALKRLEEANKRFRDSVKDLTTEAIGATRGFGEYGRLIVDLSSQTAQFADQAIVLSSAFDVTKASIEGLQRAGRFAEVAMASLNQQLLKLPNVHSSLDGVDTELDRAAQSTQELRSAISALSATLGDSIPIIGHVVSGIENISKAYSDASREARRAGSSIAEASAAGSSAALTSGLTFGVTLLITELGNAQARSDALNTALANLKFEAAAHFAELTRAMGAYAESFIAAITNARTLQEAQQAIAALSYQLDLHQQAVSKFGPSENDLLDLADTAKQVYEQMLQSGSFTADQLAAAFEEMAAAQRRALTDTKQGPISPENAAAKAAQEFSDQAVKAGYKTTDELNKSADAAEALFEFMRDSGKYTAAEVADAFDQASKAARAALTTITTTSLTADAKRQVDALRAEYQALSDSIKNEGPEKTSGIIETQTRAAMAALLKEIAALSTQTVTTVSETMTGITIAAQGQIDILKKKYKELSDSIKHEGTEKVAGIVETNIRAQMDALQKQIDALSSQTVTFQVSQAANDAEAAGYKTIAQLQDIADHAQAVFIYMRDSGLYTASAIADAFEKVGKAQDEALGRDTKAIDDLKSKYKSLNDSISQEAPEAVMGVIEQQMRAERDAIEQQLKGAQTVAQAAQAAADASADAQSDAADVTQEKWGDTSKVLKDELSQAGDDAADHIKGAFDFTIHIPIAFDNPGIPFEPMAAGGSGIVTKPTLFLAGERGPEAFSFSGANRSTTTSTSAVRQPVIIQVVRDGRVETEHLIQDILADEAGIRRVIKRVAA